MLVFDCDLAGSVKVDGFAKLCPDNYVEAGIQEHMTATAAGRGLGRGSRLRMGRFRRLRERRGL